MERLMRTGDEELAGLSLGALSFLLEEVFFLLLALCLGGMLEGDDVHLTEKKKGKSGREKKCET